MSLYSLKASQGSMQPWINTLAVGKGIFDYYDTLGDVTSMSAMSVPSFLDGPGTVVRYNNLTLSHLLTTTNRCRSLTVLVDGSLTINSGGGISMTARGARGHAGFGLYDIYIPSEMTLSSKVISLDDALTYVRNNGIDVADRWFWDEWSKYAGVSAAFSQGTALALMHASGCGASLGFASIQSVTSGSTGVAGVNGGTGSGGRGGIYAPGSHLHYVGKTGAGSPWGGGAGQGGGYSMTNAAHFPDRSPSGDAGGDGSTDNRGASGGGAGNPGGVGQYGGSNGGDGSGGVLKVIVKGSVTINSGGVVQADGMPGGSGGFAAGGSSGGGHVSLIYGGALVNNGTIRASGGASASSAGAAGGAGGAGSVVTKTFTQMGW
ncbi:hypothetical protein [Fundidesulfovibrio putealis]|uniref:hypothetical protein n=1 Tax=Fundidesulfovibrio putealis TaxID=270496 RepID=UPI00047F66CF|nr:hypothetical protein [Fundidesulfovibrio putealis]